jgi:hypothetical protein
MKEKIMKKSLILLVILICCAGPVLLAQDDPTDEIARAIRQSDAESLSGWFNATIDLGLPDNDNSYSASQGEMVMKDFFRKYPPKSFEVLQKGATDPENRFIISSYLTISGEFSVYIHLRKEKPGYRIHKIKFEDK